MESLDTLVAPADTLVLGRYRLLERLGAGGFGVVWSARDERLRREVAVKRMWLAGPPERAEREAKAAGRLSHPAIVALYEAQADGDAFYLISELVRGDTLAVLLAEGELCDDELLAAGVALAGALEHAHARGVVHRDVKPQNILVPHDPLQRVVGVAKLTDFGGARLAGEDALTRTGDVLGTLAYMAPEQCEGREATAQADLYSLALVVYEALSGVNPVRGANPAATARRIGRVLPPLHHYRRDLPHELTAALDRALAPDPQQRGTLPELREVMEDALAGRLGQRHPPTHPPAHPIAPSPVFTPQAGTAATRPARGIMVPRAVWVALAAGLAIWQALTGRPGASLLALAAVAPLLIPRRCAPLALAGGLAPALGVVGLAGVFPAVAGQARGWRERAALGAMGYWWLCLAEPLLGTRLWLAPATGGLVAYPNGYTGGGPAGAGVAAGRAAWEGSLGGAFDHVLVPLLSLGVLLGAALWAVAALLLPWFVRGRSAALDLVMASMWTAALLTAAPLLDHGLPLAPGLPAPRGALLAAILAGAFAVGARALRGPV